MLGLDRYQFGDFDCVESWVSLCLLAFVYLEWYRRQMLAESAGNAAEQRRWRWQRSHGLCLAVRQDLEEEELRLLQQRLRTPEGVAQLQEMLRRAVQKEYRKAS